MKKLLTCAALLWLGCSQLCAGDWLPWQTLGGKQLPEHRATVEIRFRRVEVGDDQQKGYLFHYELRNASATQVAKIAVSFAWKNPQTLQWEDASIDRATITEVGPKAVSAASPVYSPATTGVDHGALIVWQDGFTSPAR